MINVIPSFPNDTLVYLDATYFTKGKHLYENYYNKNEHSRLADIITQNIKHKWFVTYENTEEISNLYEDFLKNIFIKL